MANQDLVFYGDTALARTHLPMSRLSEDLDLLARPRREWTLKLERRLPPALRRHFGTTTWAVPPTTVPEDGAIQLVASDQNRSQKPTA